MRPWWRLTINIVAVANLLAFVGGFIVVGRTIFGKTVADDGFLLSPANVESLRPFFVYLEWHLATLVVTSVVAIFGNMWGPAGSAKYPEP